MDFRRRALPTFRVTLLWFVFLPCVLVLAGAAAMGGVLYAQVKQAGVELNLRGARIAAARTDDLLQRKVEALVKASAILEATNIGHRPAKLAAMGWLRDSFDEVYLLNAGLEVEGLWSSEGKTAPAGTDFSGLEAFRRLGTGAVPVWTDSLLSPQTGQSTVSLVQAFDGGILWADLALAPLNREVQAVAESSAATLALVDSHGTYLAHPEWAWVEERRTDQTFLRYRDPEQATIGYPDAGTDRWVTALSLPEGGWSVLVGQAQDSASRLLASAAWMLIALSLCLVLGALALVRLLDRRLLGALDLLRLRTEALGRGEYAPTGTSTRFRDLDGVLESFDAMRQRVWAREQELRLGELRYRRMFEDAAVGIFHSTYAGELLDMNQAMASLLGYHDATEARAALGGSTLGMYVRPEERQAFLNMLQSNSDAKVTVATEFFHRTGRVLAVNHHLARVFDAQTGEFHLEAFNEDITELKQAERAVLGLNQELEAKVLERTSHLAHALEELASAQNHLVQSEKMAALGQLISSIAHELNTPLGAIHASNDNIASLLQRVLLELPPLVHRLGPDLSRQWAQLRDAASRSIAIVPSAALRSRRNAVRATFERWKIPADSPMVDQLVELGFSDDLDPWSGLLCSPFGPEAVQAADDILSLEKSCAVIASASEKAAKVIHALRAFSHQAQESVFEKVSLRHGIETVLTLFQGRFREGITVRTNLDAEVLIWGLEDKLNQVWTNLVANAVHAMGSQGILDVTVAARGGMAIVTVSDTGSGIPEAIQGRVFDAFFTTKKRGEGSGMGLDICRKIVADHRGAITFESRPGRTVFVVQLPEAR